MLARMRSLSFRSSSSGDQTAADGNPFESGGSTQEQLEDPDLVPFLSRYGYTADTASSWQTAASSSGDSTPLLAIHVTGHEEKDGHTWYRVVCSLSSAKIKPLNWTVLRRLSQLREDLHNPVKASLAKSYDTYFSRTPFAHMGGPRGTTARLDAWIDALASCINVRNCPPSVVGVALRFIEVPPPPTILLNTKSAASAAAGKLKDRFSAAKDSAKQSVEKAQIEATQKAQAASLAAAKAHPKAAAAASSAGMSFAKDNPKMAQTAGVAAGGMAFKGLKQNPGMAFKGAKLLAKANMK